MERAQSKAASVAAVPDVFSLSAESFKRIPSPRARARHGVATDG